MDLTRDLLSVMQLKKSGHPQIIVHLCSFLSLSLSYILRQLCCLFKECFEVTKMFVIMLKIDKGHCLHLRTPLPLPTPPPQKQVFPMSHQSFELLHSQQFACACPCACLHGVLQHVVLIFPVI